MNFKEINLEDIIWENSQSEEGRLSLYERGLIVKGEIYRQVELGSYGRADLITVECNEKRKKIFITVYELKKDKVGIDALKQAFRYVTALKRHGFRDNFVGYQYVYNVRLIGSSFQSGEDMAYLYNEVSNVEVFVFKYKIDGIFFEYVEKSWSKSIENICRETRRKILNQISSELNNGLPF